MKNNLEKHRWKVLNRERKGRCFCLMRQVQIMRPFGFLKGIFKGQNPFKLAWKNIRNEVKIYGGLFVTNKRYNFGKRLWEFVSRFTWQAPQTVLGYWWARTRNAFSVVDKVEYYRGATYVMSDRPNSEFKGVTLGSFINTKGKIPYDSNGNFDPRIFDIEGPGINYLYGYMHEYGHYIQSQRSGPFYLFLYGIPSMGYSLMGRDDDFYTELDANYEAARYFRKYEEFPNWNIQGGAFGTKNYLF